MASADKRLWCIFEPKRTALWQQFLWLFLRRKVVRSTKVQARQDAAVVQKWDDPDGKNTMQAVPLL